MSLTNLQQAIFEEFPNVPYPGDSALSGCWCEECADGMAPLRGKSLWEVNYCDLFGETGPRWRSAFRVYFPVLLLGLASEEELPRWDDGVSAVFDYVTTPVVPFLAGSGFARSVDLEARNLMITQRNSRFLGRWSVVQRRIMADVLEWIRPRTRLYCLAIVDHAIENLLSGELTQRPVMADELWNVMRMRSNGLIEINGASVRSD